MGSNEIETKKLALTLKARSILLKLCIEHGSMDEIDPYDPKLIDLQQYIEKGVNLEELVYERPIKGDTDVHRSSITREFGISKEKLESLL